MRGAVLRVLRERSPRTVAAVMTSTGQPAGRVTQAIEGLARDGVIEASAAALGGVRNARIRLPED
jgi:hypothetical protein